jgi:molecular chaperone Hsp33
LATRLRISLAGDPDSSRKGRRAEDRVEALAAFRNRNNVEDQVFSAISRDGGIKVTAVTCRNLLNDLMMQQTLSAVSADCLGRTIICSILLANGMQDEQLMQITMNGDGPIRGIVAIATGKGHVRGYVGSPMLGEIPLQDAVGRGSVQIVKNHPDWPRPYNGITAIRHGDIDRDIGEYGSSRRLCAPLESRLGGGGLTVVASSLPF